MSSSRAGWKWYADASARRGRQVLSDVALLVWALVWALVWLRLAKAARHLVLDLQEPGRLLKSAGDRLSNGFGDAADKAGSTPLIGDQLQRPFSSAAKAGGAVAHAGGAEQHGVARPALAVAVAVVVVPVVAALWAWLPRRVGYAREAGAAAALRGGTELLAALVLRTLGLQPGLATADAQAGP